MLKLHEVPLHLGILGSGFYRLRRHNILLTDGCSFRRLSHHKSQLNEKIMHIDEKEFVMCVDLS